MIVAQLVEQLLPTPEVRGSKPIICKLQYRDLSFTVKYAERNETKGKKRPGWPIFRKGSSLTFVPA